MRRGSHDGTPDLHRSCLNVDIMVHVQWGTCNITGHYTDTPTKNTQVISQTLMPKRLLPIKLSGARVEQQPEKLTTHWHTVMSPPLETLDMGGDLPTVSGTRHPKGDICNPLEEGSA